jgi:uncharacterized membrane protein
MTSKMKTIVMMTLVMMISVLVISACNKGTPTLDINAQKTGFAQTADAQASQTVAAQPTVTPTLTLEPSATPTETPTGGTITLTPTATSGSETTATSITGADEAQWRAQEPEDNTKFNPGQTFTVTWKLENTGTSTWTTDYYIQFTSGDQMNAKEKVQLPYPVSPGTNVEISVDFKAPNETGEYKSVWSLVNSKDEVFYTNFFIIIKVVSD